MTLRVGRERLGQHRHLDVVGHLHLILDGCLLGCGSTQVFNIAGQRLLHLGKRVAQMVNLITTLQCRQFCLEVTLCHLVGCGGQLLQWVDGLLDGSAAKEVNHQQAYEDKHDGDARYHVTCDVDIEFG